MSSNFIIHAPDNLVFSLGAGFGQLVGDETQFVRCSRRSLNRVSVFGSECLNKTSFVFVSAALFPCSKFCLDWGGYRLDRHRR